MIFNPVRHGVIKVFGERSDSGNGVKLIDAYFRWQPAAEEGKTHGFLPSSLPCLENCKEALTCTLPHGHIRNFTFMRMAGFRPRAIISEPTLVVVD